MYRLALKHYAVIASLVPALMYIYGLSANQGYLNYWSLEPAMFPSDPKTTIYTGYLFFSLDSFSWGGRFLKLMVIVACASILFALGSMLTLKRFNKLEPVQRFINQPNPLARLIDDKARHTGFESFVILMVKSIVVLTIASMFGIVVMGAGSQAGNDNARKQHEKLMADKNYTQWKDSTGNAFRGHIITCSENYCAYLLGEKVVVLPNEDVKKVWRDAPVLNQ